MRTDMYEKQNEPSVYGGYGWKCRVCGRVVSMRSNSARSRHARVHVAEGKATEHVRTVDRKSGAFVYEYRTTP